MDEEEKKQLLSEHLKALGAKGGTARAKKLGKKKLSASAKKAAQARWGKKKVIYPHRAKYLNGARQANGLTFADISSAMDCTQEHVRLVVRGMAKGTLSLRSICERLGVSYAEANAAMKVDEKALAKKEPSGAQRKVVRPKKGTKA